jgi:hypothetical protein
MVQSKELTPNNSALWQHAIAATREKLPDKPHDNWESRVQAIAWYYNMGGRFINTRPASQFADTNLTQEVKNTLSTRGVELTANLMQHSLSYQWREYLGHTKVVIQPPNDASPKMPCEIAANDLFGIKADVGGYSILFPDATNTRFTIPHLAGYALISLSRALSRRETKFRG